MNRNEVSSFLPLMKGTRLRKFILAVLYGLAGLLAFCSGSFFLMTGSLWPKFQIEALNEPVRVRGWTENGLSLADGRTVMPKGMSKLPKESKALATVIAQGVEVDSDGGVIGLVKLWHWCGNDALVYHVARINIAHLLGYLNEGVSTLKFKEHRPVPFEDAGGGSSRGWSVSEYAGMEMWLKSE